MKKTKIVKDGILEIVLQIYLAGVFLSAVILAIYSHTLYFDDLEHLHASWLIWEGNVPYRDFFEHHNPLLWYLFAPVVALFYNQAVVLFVARLLTLSISVLTFYYFYKIITDFIANRKVALVALSLYCSNWMIVMGGSQFRPDNYMQLMQLVGLYYFFVYWEEQKRRYIVVAFGCFFLAFMFLQKVLYFFLPLGLVSLYLLYKRRLLWKDVLVAGIFPLAGVLFYGGYLYVTGSLKDYFELNWLLNMELPQRFYRRRIMFFHWSVWLQIILAFVSIGVYFRKSNIYFKTLSLVFIFEFIFKRFGFCPHPQYLFQLLLWGAILSSKFLVLVLVRNKNLLWLLCFLLEVQLYENYLKLDVLVSNRNLLDDEYPMLQYILDNSNEYDYLLSGYDNFERLFNIYRRDPHYYWFSIGRVGNLDAVLFKRVEVFDANEILRKYRPKFIFNKDYYDDFYELKYKKVRVLQSFDKKLVDELYEPTKFEYLYRLKEEKKKR